MKAKRRSGFLAVAVIALALAALCGCSAFASGSAVVVGEQAKDATQVSVLNTTGKDIEGFYFKSGSDKKYGAALAQDGLVTDGSAVTLNVPNPDCAACDMRFVTNDGAKYQIKALKVADVQDAVLKVSTAGDSCYIEYTSVSSGKAVSILESEQIAQEKAEAEAKAKAQAEKAKKEAEQAKKAKEQAEKQAAEEAKRLAQEQAAAKAAQEAAAKRSSSSKASSSSSSSSKKSSSKKSSSKKSSSKKSSSKKSSSSSKKSKSSSSSKSKKGSSSSSSKEDNRCIEL